MSLLRLGRKNRFLCAFVVPVLVVVLTWVHLVESVKGNGKRLAMLVMTFFFFAVFSSFSFPIFSTGLEDVFSGTTSRRDGASGTDSAETAFSETASWEEDLPGDGIPDGGVDPGVRPVSLAKETEIDPAELSLLEAEDVSDGYEDAELHGLEDADKYDVDEILESRVLDDYITGAEASGEAPVFSKDDWRLILINKQHPIPEDYTFSLGTIKGNMQCDERILGDLLAMLQGAKDEGLSLVILSPYRDMAYQEMLFNRKVSRYVQKGMSYMDAFKYSSHTVTVPGASEHQIGLALDIVCDTYTALDAGFGDTSAGQWLVENAARYGFILRYPKGKEYITGIEYEPWHFRYVGKDAAKVIMGAGITLEEFWEDL
ncbi:MAG: M15 family metallopeptidase [Clostridium sp.]|jgi:D-alanyl-D-alanine carboxypeptidase|nr:M15 family metallopeptidase [Clostridium sp.]